MNFKSRLRQVMAVGSVESLAVIVSGIAGLLIVNVLPKDQYAQYTFLITCMTLLIGITDTGLAHCCLPVVGRRAGEVPWVVAACSQVFRKRWWLLAIGFVIVAPYWITTTRQHDWGGIAYLLATLMIVATVLFSMREQYNSTVMTILGHISTLNRINLVSLVTRALLVGAVVLLPVTAFSLGGVLAATVLAGLASLLLYKRAFAAHDVGPHTLDASDAKRVDAEIFRIAKPLALPAIFGQLEGVITIFIVSLFGTASMLAEMGALQRIGMILIVFERIATLLVFPVIARAVDGPRLLSMVVKAHMAYIGLMAAVLLTAVIWPQYWILLIGKKYAEQQSLLWMVFMSTLLMSSSHFAFRTLAARGYTRNQTLIIPFVIAVQVLSLWVFGVETLQAVLAFNMATCLANFLYQYAMLGWWLKSQRRDQHKVD